MLSLIFSDTKADKEDLKNYGEATSYDYTYIYNLSFAYCALINDSFAYCALINHFMDYKFLCYCELFSSLKPVYGCARIPFLSASVCSIKHQSSPFLPNFSLHQVLLFNAQQLIY